MPYISTARPACAGDIGERAVAIVAVEAQRGALAFVARPIHAVDQQDVEPAVAVVIEKGAARAQGFGQILGAEGAAVVPEIDARRSGDVRQTEARVGRRRPTAARAAAQQETSRRVTRC